MINLEALSIDELAAVRDACSRRLLELRQPARRTLPELLSMLEEVKSILRDQGKQWRSLERWQWMDGQIRFWLNPTDQENYQLGWYTIDELIAWTQERGPIVRTFEDDADEADENDEYVGTTANGIPIAWLPRNARAWREARW